jgi:hypothetical protein
MMAELRAAQGEPVIVNEATDGPCDPREFWSEDEVADYNDRWTAAVEAGLAPPKE